jgi:hypothetical protein
MLLEFKEHNTILLSLGHISSHMVDKNRTHPPQHNKKILLRKKFYLQFWFCLNSLKIDDSERVCLLEMKD